MAGRRCSKTQRERRVLYAQELLLDGLSDREVWADMAEKYNLSVKQARRYTREAWEGIRANQESERDTNLLEALGRLNTLFIRAVSSGQTKVALQIQKEINALRGLYPADEIAAIKAGTDKASREEDAKATKMTQRLLVQIASFETEEDAEGGDDAAA